MPLTPFHLGPGLFFGTILFKFLNFFAFLVGNIAFDIEPFFRIFIFKTYPWHGFFHTFLGALIVSFLLTLILYIFKNQIKKSLDGIHLIQPSPSFLNLFLALLFGSWLHIIFDSFVHPDVYPFWPSNFNPLLNLLSMMEIYLLTTLLGIIGATLLIIKISKKPVIK